MIWAAAGFRNVGYDDMTVRESGKRANPIIRLPEERTEAEIENFRANVARIVGDMRKAKRKLSWIAKESKVNRQTLDRWQNKGISGITDEVESFCKRWGIEPKSMWMKKPIEAKPPSPDDSRFSEIIKLFNRFIASDPTDSELSYMAETLKRAIR